MQKNPIKKKTAAELKKEAALRKKNAKKSGHSARSKAAKKGAKSMSKSERVKRALKSWKTRRKLYGNTGTTVKASTEDAPMKKAHLTPEGRALALKKAKQNAKRISDKKALEKANKDNKKANKKPKRSYVSK